MHEHKQKSQQGSEKYKKPIANKTTAIKEFEQEESIEFVKNIKEVQKGSESNKVYKEHLNLQDSNLAMNMKIG